MLDLSNDPGVSRFDWEAVELKTCLPSEWGDFFDRRGPSPIHPECHRRFTRQYLRSRAILCRPDGSLLGVYTGDVSRSGLRILSPVQLFPKDRCRLQLPSTAELLIEIVRCRRFESQCYECGAVFGKRD